MLRPYDDIEQRWFNIVKYASRFTIHSQQPLIHADQPAGELVVAERARDLLAPMFAEAPPQRSILAQPPDGIGVGRHVVARAEETVLAVIDHLRQRRGIGRD